MVVRNIRGKRLASNLRKLQGRITEKHLGRNVYNAFRRGDSQTSIIRMLRDKGVSVGRDGLNRFLASKYSFDQLINYDSLRRLKSGARSGLSLKSFQGLYQAQDILLKVTLQLGDGSIRTFNRYVRNFEGQTLQDIYAEIEVTYGETNMDSDTSGEILNIQFA